MFENKKFSPGKNAEACPVDKSALQSALNNEKLFPTGGGAFATHLQLQNALLYRARDNKANHVDRLVLKASQLTQQGRPILSETLAAQAPARKRGS